MQLNLVIDCKYNNNKTSNYMAARVKHKIDLKHETNAQELIFSLSKMQSWLEILIANQENDYNDFSKWLLTDGFVSNLLKRMSIMQMAKEFGHSNAPKITKWLYEIYDDIFNLHLEKPELFTTGNGIAQRYFVSENETYANLYYCLPVIPRKYEEIRIPFLKAKFGIDFFWVCKVD